jgi:putative ubiquitin-RnfH superfamily antitoxin RatB of RatAB toxin-antitoxin module
VEDVQRFYMVICPREHTSKKSKAIYRLFLLGAKQLPEIVEGKSKSTERNWALNILTTSDSEDIKQEILIPAEYSTETRGERKVAAASPAGEGKYSIVQHDNHTELAYILELPEVPGPTQREFEIKKEASYIISVKNPDISVKGFAAFASARKPEYSKSIIEKFGNRRWINVDDPQLLNFENTQLLLIGARKKDIEEELGIDINEEKETLNSADLYAELKVKKDQIPTKPLLKGEFPGRKDFDASSANADVKKLSKEETPGRKGGRIGGKVASTKAVSAATVTKLLNGIDLSKSREGLVEYAEKVQSKAGQQGRIEVAKDVIDAIKELPSDRSYYTMADITAALGEMPSSSQFTCAICGQGFEQKSRFERHMETSHPPRAPSAADIEKALAGIDYPKSKQDLVRYVSQKSRTVESDLVQLIQSLPERSYRDSAEVAIALGEIKGGRGTRTAKEAESKEQPSKKGGKVAAQVFSAAAIAKVLSGIDFPKSRNGIRNYARKNLDKGQQQPKTKTILDLLNRIPEKQYSNMADVEREAAKVL